MGLAAASIELEARANHRHPHLENLNSSDCRAFEQMF
jgi:hypothetical protein